MATDGTQESNRQTYAEGREGQSPQHHLPLEQMPAAVLAAQTPPRGEKRGGGGVTLTREADLIRSLRAVWGHECRGRGGPARDGEAGAPGAVVRENRVTRERAAQPAARGVDLQPVQGQHPRNEGVAAARREGRAQLGRRVA